MVQWCCLVQVFFTDPCKTQANLKSFSRKIKTLDLKSRESLKFPHQIQTSSFRKICCFCWRKDRWQKSQGHRCWVSDQTWPNPGWWWLGTQAQVGSLQLHRERVDGGHGSGSERETPHLPHPMDHEPTQVRKSHCLNFTSIRKPTEFQSSWGSKSIPYVICRPWLGPFK